MNLTRPAFVILIVLSLFTAHSDATLVLLLLIKLIALKGALFLGLPLALGAFLLGQGVGFFAGKLTGGLVVLNSATKWHRREIAKLKHGGHGYAHGGHGGYNVHHSGGYGWKGGAIHGGFKPESFSHNPYSHSHHPNLDTRHYGVGYKLGKTAGNILNFPKSVILRLRAKGYGAKPVSSVGTYTPHSGFGAGHSHSSGISHGHTSYTAGHGHGHGHDLGVHGVHDDHSHHIETGYPSHSPTYSSISSGHGHSNGHGATDHLNLDGYSYGVGPSSTQISESHGGYSHTDFAEPPSTTYGSPGGSEIHGSGGYISGDDFPAQSSSYYGAPSSVSTSGGYSGSTDEGISSIYGKPVISTTNSDYASISQLYGAGTPGAVGSPGSPGSSYGIPTYNIDEGSGLTKDIASEAYYGPPSGLVTEPQVGGYSSSPSQSYGDPTIGLNFGNFKKFPESISSFGSLSGLNTDNFVQEEHDSYSQPPASSYINGPPAKYSPSSDGSINKYAGPSGSPGIPLAAYAPGSQDLSTGGYDTSSSDIYEKIVNSGAKWSDYPPKKAESNDKKSGGLFDNLNFSSLLSEKSSSDLDTADSQQSEQKVMPPPEKLIEQFVQMKLLDAKDTKSLIETLRSMYINQLLESFSKEETPPLDPIVPNGTTEPATPVQSSTILSTFDDHRPKRQTSKTQHEDDIYIEKYGVDKAFFNSFYSEISKFFTLLGAFDQDSCLQKLVCDVHTRTRSPKLNSYESNMITTFKIMNVMIPLNHLDSSTKYRVAARLGERSGMEEVCQKTYDSCKYSSSQIINLGTQVEQNVATEDLAALGVDENALLKSPSTGANEKKLAESILSQIKEKSSQKQEDLGMPKV